VAKVVKGLANSKGVFTPVPKWSGVFIIQAARASDIPTVDLSDALSDALSDTADPGNILRRLSDKYLYFARTEDGYIVGGSFRASALAAKQVVTWQDLNAGRLTKEGKRALRESRKALRNILGKSALL